LIFSLCLKWKFWKTIEVQEVVMEVQEESLLTYPSKIYDLLRFISWDLSELNGGTILDILFFEFWSFCMFSLSFEEGSVFCCYMALELAKWFFGASNFYKWKRISWTIRIAQYTITLRGSLGHQNFYKWKGISWTIRTAQYPLILSDCSSHMAFVF